MTDLWQTLKTASDSGRPILLYGMGNGADKILTVCEAYGIPVADFFASDGFVRGHSFHGKVVLSFCVQGCYYTFTGYCGQMDEKRLVALLASIARAAQGIRM